MSDPGSIASSVPANCRLCGVCCFSPSSMYVRVTGADWTRLGAAAAEVAVFNGHQAFMRMHHGHCAALRIATNAEGERDYVCSVYELRPQTCRDLDRGSPACQGDRETKANRVHGRPLQRDLNPVGTRP